MDGLRGLSILAVLLAHACKTAGFPFKASFLSNGDVGVDVFFVLSGFLITLLLTREMDRTGAISWSGFYRRRILRIIPAYAAFLLVMAALQMKGIRSFSLHDWVSALTFTMNHNAHRAWDLGHLWSLSIEEQFYFLWPLLIIGLGLKRAKKAAFTYLYLAPFLRLGVWLLSKAHHVNYVKLTGEWTIFRMDSIAIGCLLALCAVDPAGINLLDDILLRNRAGLKLSLLLLASLALRRFTLPSVFFGQSLEALSVAGLVWVSVQSPFARWLEWKPLAGLGLLSYSLYLWQQPFLDANAIEGVCRFPVNLLCAFGAALASYSCIERPFLKLKRSAQGAPLPPIG